VNSVCTTIDLSTMTLGETFNIEEAWRSFRGDNKMRPNLNPPQRWQGLLPCSLGSVSPQNCLCSSSETHPCRLQDRYFVAYAHAPTDSAMDQAKDLTTVALLVVDPKSHALSAVGFNTLPGQGQIAVVQGIKG
jgi:hypothetical protein